MQDNRLLLSTRVDAYIEYSLNIFMKLDFLGSRCGKNFFQCGGNDPQCVSDLLVCDGQPDCRNGADERDCGESAVLISPD